MPRLVLMGKLEGEGVLAGTCGWSNWTDATITNVALSAGSQTLRVDLFGRFANLNWLELRSAESGSSSNGGSVTSLLTNGGFESGLTDWLAGSAVDGASIVPDSVEGNNALQMTDNDCVCPLFEVASNATYTLCCEAKSEQTAPASFKLSMKDQNFADLIVNEVDVTSTSYQPFSVTSTAPSNAVFATATFHNNNTGVFDACTVIDKGGSCECGS